MNSLVACLNDYEQDQTSWLQDLHWSAAYKVYCARSHILSRICVWSKRPGRYVNSLGACLNQYEQDQTCWLQDLHRSAAQVVYCARSDILSMIYEWSKHPGRVVRSLETCISYYKQDQTCWLQDLHRSAAQEVYCARSHILSAVCAWPKRPGRFVCSLGSLSASIWARSDVLIAWSAQICSTWGVLCKIRHTEHDLCVIKTSWTLCKFIGSLTELLWARSDILIARSAQICSTGGVLCKIRHTEHDLFVIKTSWTFCKFIGSIPESLWARSDILIARSAQIYSTGGVLCKIRHTEHDLCIIKTSWTFCIIIGILSDSLWARSDILIARSAQICST
jgi:hypothetical protein